MGRYNFGKVRSGDTSTGAKTSRLDCTVCQRSIDDLESTKQSRQPYIDGLEEDHGTRGAFLSEEREKRARGGRGGRHLGYRDVPLLGFEARHRPSSEDRPAIMEGELGGGLRLVAVSVT